MAEMWKPLKVEDYLGWCHDILEESSDALNNWEAKFVDDIQNKLLKNWNLNQNQAEKLEQIYAKHTK